MEVRITKAQETEMGRYIEINYCFIDENGHESDAQVDECRYDYTDSNDDGELTEDVVWNLAEEYLTSEGYKVE